MRKHLASHEKGDFRSITSQPDFVETTTHHKHFIIGALITILNISFRAFSHPLFRILFWLARLGTVNDTIARQIVDSEFKRVQSLLKGEITELRQKGAVFTLVVDEWCKQRKRFIGVLLCASEPFPCLGKNSVELLVRFREQASGENLLKAIEEVLRTYDISFDSIYGITTDAASSMVALGKLIAGKRGARPFFHQKCHAHGLHLAVLETLNEKSLPGTASGGPNSEFSGFGTFGVIEDTSGMEEEEAPPEPDGVQNEVEVFDTGHWVLIRKVRCVFQEFRHSGLRSDRFESVCRRGNFKHLAAHPDLSHRWDSTMKMLDRFLELETPLRIYYEEKDELFPLSEPEMEAVKSILPALKIVADASSRLQEDATTLFDSELIFQYAFKRLDKLILKSKHVFVENLVADLEKHIAKRRTISSRCAMYMKTQQLETFLDSRLNQSDDLGSVENGIKKFFIDARHTDADEDVSHDSEEEEDDPDASYEAFSRRFMKTQRSARRRADARDVGENAVKRARLLMELVERAHEEDGDASRFPRKMLALLDTLRPTSACVERTFSKAGYQRTSRQQRLDDERAARKLTLRDFYAHNKPWEAFMKKHGMTTTSAPLVLRKERPRPVEKENRPSTRSSTRTLRPRGRGPKETIR